jgi:hypothetical protein
MTAEVIMDRRVTVSAPGDNYRFRRWVPSLTEPCLRTPVHEGLGYRGLRGERIFPDRIQGDAVSSACVVYGSGQDQELPSIARLQGVPPFHSCAGRSTSNQNSTRADWAERRFFKACGNLQWNNIICRCGSSTNTNADEHGPPAPVVPPLVSGRLFLGGLLLSRARLRFAGLPL